MGVMYALYSKNRNVMYNMDKQSHDQPWSKYIRSKFPHDEWMLLKDCEEPYFSVLEKAEQEPNYKEVDLLDPDDKEGWGLYQEIKNNNTP